MYNYANFYKVMIVDLFQEIVGYLKLKDQLKCMMIDKYLYNNIYIYLLECPSEMDQDILEQTKFRKLKILKCHDNERIYSVNHLADTLIKLNCCWKSNIDQDGISQLKLLKILKCDDNRKIHSVNHLANTLIELNCSYDSKIDQHGISQLKLLNILKCYDNRKIYSVNHLANILTELDCGGESKINQNGICRLKSIKILKCDLNGRINDVNHLVAKQPYTFHMLGGYID